MVAALSTLTTSSIGGKPPAVQGSAQLSVASSVDAVTANAATLSTKAATTAAQTMVTITTELQTSATPVQAADLTPVISVAAKAADKVASSSSKDKKSRRRLLDVSSCSRHIAWAE